jgi:hypothetical protein
MKDKLQRNLESIKTYINGANLIISNLEEELLELNKNDESYPISTSNY